MLRYYVNTYMEELSKRIGEKLPYTDDDGKIHLILQNGDKFYVECNPDENKLFILFLSEDENLKSYIKDKINNNHGIENEILLSHCHVEEDEAIFYENINLTGDYYDIKNKIDNFINFYSDFIQNAR